VTQSGVVCSPTCGSLFILGTNQVIYSAPAIAPSLPIVTLTAFSLADGTKSATAAITITPTAPTIVAVSVTPASSSLPVSQTEMLTATVTGDPQGEGVSWFLTQSGSSCSPSCGTLSAGFNQVLYSAPASLPAPANVTLTAVSLADSSKSGAAQITVTAQAPPSPVSVSISPNTPSILVSQTESFTASVNGDSQSRGVTWTLTQSASACNPTCGSFVATSVSTSIYAAPSVVPYPSVVTLTATSIADNTKSASTTITIAPLSSSPGGASGLWINVKDFGARAFKFPAQTGACSIGAGSPMLTCASPLDWVNGDGVRVDKAGAMPTLAIPGGLTVTPVGVLNGNTTYTYQIFAQDYDGSFTAASDPVTTTAGASTLGVNSVPLSGCVDASNARTTYTTSVPQSFQPGVTVWIDGTTDRTRCDGVVTIAPTPAPTPTSFLSSNYDGYHKPITATGGTAKVLAGNRLTWTPTALTDQYRTIRYWVCRNYEVVGVSQGADAYYVDYDYGISSPPSYLPKICPMTPTPGWLSTTITAGAGSKTLTLANPAITTATNQLSYHDNAPALMAAFNMANAMGGGNILIPSWGDKVTTYPFTTTAVFPPGFNRLLLAGGVTLYESWVLTSLNEIDGQYGSGNFNQYPVFGIASYAVIQGFAYPMLYSQCKSGSRFKQLFVINDQSQQWGLLMDTAGNATGAACANTQMEYEDFYVGSGGAGTVAAVVRGGGFGHNFLRGGLLTGTGGGLAQEALQILSSQNQGRNGALTGKVTLDGTFFAGKALKIDNTPGGGFAGGADYYVIKNFFFESTAGPLINAVILNNAFNCCWQISNVNGADPTVGYATPMVDITNATNVTDLSITDSSLGSAWDPIFSGATAVFYPTLSSVSTANIGIPGDNRYSVVTTNDVDVPLNVSIPGTLTSAITSLTYTPDRAITITRIQAQVVTPPAGCAVNAVISLSDGTDSIFLTITQAANDSGTINQTYLAGKLLTVGVVTPATGCATAPAQANIAVQYNLRGGVDSRAE
jgi:hypothetical protein